MTEEKAPDITEPEDADAGVLDEEELAADGESAEDAAAPEEDTSVQEGTP